ncbi:hypothetical protein HNR42_000021 [Deinobacterium chartae]|uniref:DUF2834 domain-containing protein n=1 Tax=Deinobacterium chartae TaxID=521158 RepID=A0A841HWI5_9DEIO|nr:DUF2834 domain-containing protein [Deinobacterium chartae]MBB6096609.1 hypothetical protein [Deinobacterium chartae]
MMQWIYLTLTVLGSVFPLAQFVPWLSVHALDLPLLLAQALQTRIAAFAWADVLFSALTVTAFAAYEGPRRRVRAWWLPVICTVTIGPSCGLPLFLFLRERAVLGR